MKHSYFFTGSTLEPSLLNVATAIGVSAEATTWPCIWNATSDFPSIPWILSWRNQKVIIQRLTPSAGCDLVKKFLCCYNSLQSPPTPSWRSSYKIGITSEKERRKRRLPKSPTEFVSWRKMKKNAFLCLMCCLSGRQGISSRVPQLTWMWSKWGTWLAISSAPTSQDISSNLAPQGRP